MRRDYAIAKILALTTAVTAIVLIPNVLLLVGGVLASSNPSAYIQDNVDRIPPLLAATAAIAACMSSISLAVAVQTPRRAFATAGILALFVIPPPLVAILVFVVGGLGGRLFIFFDLFNVLGAVNDWLFGLSQGGAGEFGPAGFREWIFLPVSGLYIAISAALVFRRYETIDV